MLHSQILPLAIDDVVFDLPALLYATDGHGEGLQDIVPRSVEVRASIRCTTVYLLRDPGFSTIAKGWGIEDDRRATNEWPASRSSLCADGSPVGTRGRWNGARHHLFVVIGRSERMNRRECVVLRFAVTLTGFTVGSSLLVLFIRCLNYVSGRSGWMYTGHAMNEPCMRSATSLADLRHQQDTVLNLVVDLAIGKSLRVNSDDAVGRGIFRSMRHCLRQ